MSAEIGIVVALCGLAATVLTLAFNAGRLTERVTGHAREIRDMRTYFEREITELKAMNRAAIGERRNWRDPDG